MECGEADGDPGQRQQERKTGGDGRAEGQVEQDDGGQARQQLRPVQRSLVLGVEVVPHGPLAGGVGLGSGGQGDTVNGLHHPTGGLGQSGILPGRKRHRDQRGPAVTAEESGSRWGSQRIDHPSSAAAVTEGGDQAA